MTDTRGTHIIVHRREVSAVWSFHLLIYSILGQQDFPLFGSVRCIEVSVSGGFTVCCSLPSFASF